MARVAVLTHNFWFGRHPGTIDVPLNQAFENSSTEGITTKIASAESASFAILRLGFDRSAEGALPIRSDAEVCSVPVRKYRTAHCADLRKAAYSTLASLYMGKSGSAFFQSARNSP